MELLGKNLQFLDPIAPFPAVPFLCSLLSVNSIRIESAWNQEKFSLIFLLILGVFKHEILVNEMSYAVINLNGPPVSLAEVVVLVKYCIGKSLGPLSE